MSYIAELTIPKIESEDNVLLYVYRSTYSEDINTISKISNLTPIIIINQSLAETVTIDEKEYYKIQDKEPNEEITGVTYNGPPTNTIPVNEYEYNIHLIMLNNYTHVNELILSPLELSHKDGIVFYYSVIGVIPDKEQITHLSKVNGVLVNYISNQDLIRELQSCDDYNDSDEDEWITVSHIEYNETTQDIRIGDINKQNTIDKFGLPVVQKVPSIRDVKVSLNSLISNTYMTLEIENPWQNNNKYFNFRKLKSYRIRNTYQSQAGSFSVPTYQSELPVSIEKIIILMKQNPSDSEEIILINDDSAIKFECIRRNGIFYNNIKHKSLNYNLWNVPLENNKLSVFSETSVQDTINIQISAVPGNLYVFDIYLVDVYSNVSDNKHYIVET